MTFLFLWIFLPFSVSVMSCSPDEEPELRDTEIPVPSRPDQPGGNENNNNTDSTDNAMNRNMTIRVGNNRFAVALEDNDAGKAFAAMLPVTLAMNGMNGNEKYYYLSVNLPTASYRPGTIRNGDLMLYGSDCVVLFYETFSSSYSYTRLGRVLNPHGLAVALGRGNVTVTFEINQKNN